MIDVTFDNLTMAAFVFTLHGASRAITSPWRQKRSARSMELENECGPNV